MQQAQFKVERAQAEGFSKVWKTPGGIHIAQTPASLQFATDFANVVLRGFIDMCKHQAQEHAKQAEAAIIRHPHIVGAEDEQNASAPAIELVGA